MKRTDTESEIPCHVEIEYLSLSLSLSLSQREDYLLDCFSLLSLIGLGKKKPNEMVAGHWISRKPLKVERHLSLSDFGVRFICVSLTHIL